MRSSSYVTRDLAEHVPGQSLITKLLTEWDAGRIRRGDNPHEIVIDDDSRGWYWGVLGERAVADVLAGIAPPIVALHSIPIGTRGADVDHLAIGPGGVFTINTKYHARADIWTAGHGLLVNGVSRAEYLRNSVHEAQRVEKSLSAAAGFAVPVYPVIVFVGAASFTRKALAAWNDVAVLVTTAEELPVVLDTRRELSDAQLARTVAAARAPSTWPKASGPSLPGAHLAREFDALREAVGPALEPRGNRGAPLDSRPQASRKSTTPRLRTPDSTGKRVALALLGGCLGVVVLPVAAVSLIQLLLHVIGALMRP